MKTRQGFVSNSSTASFVICGVYCETEADVIERVRPFFKNTEQMDKFEELFSKDIYGAESILRKELGMELYSTEYHEYYIGYGTSSEVISFKRMKEMIEMAETRFGSDNAAINVIVEEDR